MVITRKMGLFTQKAAFELSIALDLVVWFCDTSRPTCSMRLVGESGHDFPISRLRQKASAWALVVGPDAGVGVGAFGLQGVERSRRRVATERFGGAGAASPLQG